MDIREKPRIRIGQAVGRLIRFAMACAMAVVLCPATFGLLANFAVATIATFSLPESSEKTSNEEESRDTSPKLFRVRTAWSKDGHSVPIQVPVCLRRSRTHRSRLLTSPISTECLGPGLYLRC